LTAVIPSFYPIKGWVLWHPRNSRRNILDARGRTSGHQAIGRKNSIRRVGGEEVSPDKHQEARRKEASSSATEDRAEAQRTMTSAGTYNTVFIESVAIPHQK